VSTFLLLDLSDRVARWKEIIIWSGVWIRKALKTFFFAYFEDSDTGSCAELRYKSAQVLRPQKVPEEILGV
jgi:hypothetical protein